MKITAVVPVRSGSKRVPGKNTRPFSDTTLLELKLNTLSSIEEIDEIIVNTDSDEAAAIVNSKYAGTNVRLHMREPYYASSECSGSEFFKHLGEVTQTDIFLYTPCTSPFVTPDTIKQVIRKYIEGSSTNICDSVSTVSAVHEFLWKDGRPLNYEPSSAPNSQDLPDIYALNFGVSAISRDDLISRSNIIGNRPLFIPTDELQSIDIDTKFDFLIAERLYEYTKKEREGYSNMNAEGNSEDEKYVSRECYEMTLDKMNEMQKELEMLKEDFSRLTDKYLSMKRGIAELLNG